MNVRADSIAPAPGVGDPGLLVLHGNRLEDLAEVVFDWIARHPLAPLEQETVLVQSNGMAEWFKMSLAGHLGVCAATRVELPARFLWRVYRAVLGRHAVPAVLPADKQPLVWRLMSLLPALLASADTAPLTDPLRRACGGGDALRRLQLCQRIADRFDQYQVYRSDWLEDWSHGRDCLRTAPGEAAAAAPPVPDEQRWQPLLWRALLQGLPAHERECTRPALQRRCVQALKQAAAGAPAAARSWPALPRRVVLFGSTQLPQPLLELLDALSPHVQVILAVPNPCRYFWADLIDGRERLAIARRRQPLRAGTELAALPLQALHAHGHPLLAAWGRQARDFVRQLDAYDDVQRSRQRFELPRVDLFDDGPGQNLLQQVQACIRDGVPLAEHARVPPAASDRSIGFYVAHSAQREVEILHDQLLRRLAGEDGSTPLQPRDIVVMVPDIETHAAAIRAVFGSLPRGHARHIPWGIADVHARGQQPLLRTLEWLLQAPGQRFGAGEWRDLLELRACAGRFGLGPDDLPTLLDWLQAAGVRWGLDAEQRRSLGLQAAGEVGSWRFGLQRLLLGYAAGDLPDGWQGIEPFAEVGGLSARLVGALAEMAQVLHQWWEEGSGARRPEGWVARARQLLQAFFDGQDDADQALLAALDEALSRWLQACEAAGFDEAVELPVFREAWLGGLQEPGAAQRFKAGGVTFCTLLPMRAIPFELVCLLGMNEGDYPRAAAPTDLDLMALPGQSRPGDRSRRDDDRQLMLDALLSARRALHISWVGRSQRDNTAQPPSVLVAQLRDYLDAGWGEGVCASLTVEHPLQPFSRRYFEAGADASPQALFTYAAEWRQAHDPDAASMPVTEAARRAAAVSQPPAPATPEALRLDLAQLGAFLRNPVRAFFRHRLKVVFDDEALADLPDEESFGGSALEHSQWVNSLLERSAREPLARALRRLSREGRLPLANAGVLEAQALQGIVEPMLAEQARVLQAHRQRLAPLDLRLEVPGEVPIIIEDVIDGLWADDDQALAGLRLSASRLRDRRGTERRDKLLGIWLTAMASAAAGRPAQWQLIGTDAVAVLAPVDPDQARQILQALAQTVAGSLLEGRPLATAARTGLAWMAALEGEPADPAAPLNKARQAYDAAGRGGAEGAEPCLQRAYPGFDALLASGHFESDTQRLYGGFVQTLPSLEQLEPLPDAASATSLDAMNGTLAARGTEAGDD
jgi:exodeoxyribonuclease V gamma subunit